jgi:amidase
MRFSAINTGRVAPRRDDVERMSWAIWLRANQIDAVSLGLIEVQLQARMRMLVASLAPYDALITPALAKRPLPLGSLDTSAADGWGTFRRSGHFTPFTAVFNLSGLPAISLPLFHGEDGLPLAVQVVGRPAGEGELLALAAALEAAAPPRTLRPQIS